MTIEHIEITRFKDRDVQKVRLVKKSKNTSIVEEREFKLGDILRMALEL